MVEGDTVFTIAQRFGSSVEAIAAANHLPDPTAISVGQVLIIPDAAFTPGPTTAPAATQAPDPRLTGFVVPIAGACLPADDYRMPNAPREYRAGIHEGVDFYAGDSCVDIPAGTPVLAAKGGTVLRADHDYAEWTQEELDAALERSVAQGYTNAEDLDHFRGRQVWIDHGNGVVTRYSHLEGIAPGVTAGRAVGSGEVIGYVGDSGTPEAVTSPGVEIHLHWEVRVDGSFLGAGRPVADSRRSYESLLGG